MDHRLHQPAQGEHSRMQQVSDGMAFCEDAHVGVSGSDSRRQLALFFRMPLQMIILVKTWRD